ncbi:unnamed protein product [Closterium sp. Naga37s-1]|nr:unnamed protein product [Closterium sp. Naga37s-1]
MLPLRQRISEPNSPLPVTIFETPPKLHSAPPSPAPPSPAPPSPAPPSPAPPSPAPPSPAPPSPAPPSPAPPSPALHMLLPLRQRISNEPSPCEVRRIVKILNCLLLPCSSFCSLPHFPSLICRLWGKALWGNAYLKSPLPNEVMGRMSRQSDFLKKAHWWRAQATRFMLRWPSAYLCHIINRERHHVYGMHVARQVVASQTDQRSLLLGKSSRAGQRTLLEDSPGSGNRVSEEEKEDGTRSAEPPEF